MSNGGAESQFRETKGGRATGRRLALLTLTRLPGLCRNSSERGAALVHLIEMVRLVVHHVLDLKTHVVVCVLRMSPRAIPRLG